MNVTERKAPSHAYGQMAEFRRLFEAELPFVLRTLRRLGVSDADLSDVAQELFLTVLGRLHEVVDPSSVRKWLYAFCVRFSSNYRRLARHRAICMDDNVERTLSDDVREAAAARDLVLSALDKLDFDRRLVLVLHDLEGVSAPEIAAMIDIPLNTVYSRIRLAREAFREEIVHLTRVTLEEKTGQL